MLFWPSAPAPHVLCLNFLRFLFDLLHRCALPSRPVAQAKKIAPRVLHEIALHLHRKQHTAIAPKLTTEESFSLSSLFPSRQELQSNLCLLRTGTVLYADVCMPFKLLLCPSTLRFALNLYLEMLPTTRLGALKAHRNRNESSTTKAVTCPEASNPKPHSHKALHSKLQITLKS